MPIDKFGLPFFHPTKTNGFFYQQEDNPQNSNFVDWPDEMSFPGNGIVRMDPDGPTDFGIGKNISGFQDSIGGCNMDFQATAARGYAYKPDDPRDIEYKCLVDFHSIDPDEGFSISCCTGHHGQPEPCCQGFTYMGNLKPGLNPCVFRFRKEMWHVDYYVSPEGEFTDNRVNFKLNEHGYVGFGFCRYNKPNTTDRVVLEMWFNADPEDHPVDGWFLLKKIEDFPGNGWGNSGDECNGDSDQVGTWSNAQNRCKTNSTGGFVNFRSISLREIDVTKSFDDTPPPPPPPPVPNVISEQVIYSVIGCVSANATTAGITNLAYTTEGITEEMVEGQVNPYHGLNTETGEHGGWFGDNSLNPLEQGRGIADTPCDGAAGRATYADGLLVAKYWSNRHNNCIAPGASATDLGNSTDIINHGGRVLQHPVINLIFWGVEWNTQTNPSRNEVIAEVRDKLLDTDIQYFDELNQYSGCGAPTYGTAITDTTTAYPNDNDIDFDNDNKVLVRSIITKALTSGALPILQATIANQMYVILLRKETTILGNQVAAYGHYYRATITLPSSGGGGSGGGTPPGGGGTGTPSQISPVISYVLINANTTGRPTFHPPMTGVQSMMLAISEDLAETMTNPNPAAIDGPQAWRGAATGSASEGEIGDLPCDHDFGADTNLPQVYTFADGIMVEPYWSNKDNACSLNLSGAPPGGTNPPPTTVSAGIPITFLFNVEEYADDVGLSNADYMALVFGEEVIEGITDPEHDGWETVNDTNEGVTGQIGERCDGTGNIAFQGTYSDGIVMEAYWSNQHHGCALPGLYTGGARNPGETSENMVYKGGRVQKNAVINLIFWGSSWSTQTGPSKANMETRIRDKLLNPASNSNQFFNLLNQYSGIQAPTFGKSILWTANEPPGTFDFPENEITADMEKALNMVEDAILANFTTGDYNNLANQQIVILLPTESQSGGDGVHFTIDFSFQLDSHNDTTIDAVAATDSTIDADGIAWLEATGEILSWGMSRDDPGDFRWSHDTENAGLGYEVTWFCKVQNMTSGGHTAMKLGGGNHSGDCGGNTAQKESNSCCCWYDLGIRANGDVQVQIERPHPSNGPFLDLPEFTMDNIGVSMNNHWIGLKHIIYPEVAGGDVEHGGIRIKSYISIDAIVGGIPTNQWDLVYNVLDTGQILPDYEWPMYQELEMRLSDVDDTNDAQLYKDKVFARRWIRGSTGGGGGTPTCPPGQVWDGLACVPIGNGRITYHGGRVMKTPIVNLIFWGQAWNDRAVTPTKAEMVTAVSTKLFVTDKAYFNNLNQYSGIGVPIFGQAVTNTTYPIPTATLISEEDGRLVINDTIEHALLPQNPDFNNTVYIVFMPIGKTLYHPQNNVQPDATHNSYKPTLTVTDTGGPDQPTNIIVVQGAFSLKSDINVYTTTTCSGSELPPPPPDEPPVDPGGGGGTSIFYKVTSTSNQKEISNESSSDNRTQITEKVNSSSSAMKDKLLKQADVLLRKESGTTDVTPLIYFKIWDSGNNVLYTSPTTFTPNELTTSFVGKTFDCSTNTHVFVVGDRCGCEFTGTDPNEFIWTAYATSDSGNTGSSGSYSVYKEGSSYDNQTSRRCSFTLWE